MNIQELEARLAVWKDLLRLRDWQVDLHLCRRHDLPVETSSAAGCCRWDLSERLAFVHLVVEEDITKLDAPYRDQERTLVHELVHVVFAAARDHGETRDWEQAVNDVTTALVELERRRAP